MASGDKTNGFDLFDSVVNILVYGLIRIRDRSRGQMTSGDGTIFTNGFDFLEVVDI